MAILKLRGIDTATGQHTDINEMEWNDATPQLNVGGTGVSRVLLRGETSGVDAGRIQSVHLNTTDTSRLWAAMILDHNTTGINPAAGLGSYIRFRGYDDTDTIRNMMDLRTRVVLGQSTNWTTEFELWLSRGPSSFENPFKLTSNFSGVSLNEAFWSANHRFNTDNVYDIGNSGTERPRNMYLTSTITGGRRGVAADQGRFVITTDTVGSSNSPDLYLVTSTAGTFTCGSIFIEPGGSNSLGLSASGTGGNVIIRGGNGSTTNGSIEIRSGAGIGTAGDVRLGTGNTNRWGINGSRLFAVSDGIYDIGADGDLRPQTLYLTTSIIGGNEGSNFSIAGPASATSGVAGTSISIACGAGNTTGNGGSFVLSAGLGGDSVASTTDAANGGSITIVAAAGGIGNATGPQSAGDGGNLILDAGPAGAANGGNFGIAGTLSLGVTNASSIVIGNTSATCNIAASNITVNSLPLPSVLSTTSVDLTSTGDNTLYTVPTGFSAKILGVMITPTVVTAPNGDATISVGTNVTRDDIFTAQALTGLNTTTESYTIWATGIVHLAAASELIRFEVDSADTGTAITVDVDLIGYLV